MVRSERGGRKSVHGGGVDKVTVTGLTTVFQYVTFDALFLGEKVWGGGMILI